jgi:hypothetical protein
VLKWTVIVALVAAVAVTGGGAVAGGSDSVTWRDLPILTRCPRAADRLHVVGATADEVIAVARAVNRREVTHYQGRAERRTDVNTPVVQLVMDLRDVEPLPGKAAVARRAVRRCGKVGLDADAVTFRESLSPVCCLTFTLFVARGARAWIVFRVPRLT